MQLLKDKFQLHYQNKTGYFGNKSQGLVFLPYLEIGLGQTLFYVSFASTLSLSPLFVVKQSFPVNCNCGTRKSSCGGSNAADD